MHIPHDWNDRIIIVDGKITRILEAEWTSKQKVTYKCDVYMENEDGESWEQNLYGSMYGGHSVAFPGLPYNDTASYYYNPDIAEEEGWCKRSSRSKVGWTCNCNSKDFDLVYLLHPDFKYVVKKYNISNRTQLIDILLMWKKHPELELILACGFYKIGMNGNFWRLSEKNRKDVCLFIRKHPDCKDLTLKDVRDCIKSGKPDLYVNFLQDVPPYQRNNYYTSSTFDISFEDYLYLRKLKGIKKDCFNSVMARKVSIYHDILNALRETHHDANDEYWRHPKNIFEIHDRLQEEVHAIREAERLARELQIKKENAARVRKINGLLKKLSKVPQDVDGYSIFVTKDMDIWKKQADVLHQCIVASGYFRRMCDKQFIIVFIQKSGVPIATAQVMPDGSVNQFYADERDRKNCLPSEEVKTVFYKWLETAKSMGVINKKVA